MEGLRVSASRATRAALFSHRTYWNVSMFHLKTGFCCFKTAFKLLS